ncbi:ABC transporter permease [Sorangium cellulosum]|jgi:NitT/TauT family transport system permease protein|uniref:ABC transporter permease n=1 Tax=Sorangium cellulosum TaxID=56 RepID=A0A4V0NDG4_SORCE|nr:ABC transporter permease [Sorangium cellulosum]AUX22582.1 ABC transporter permease [Sorangium cellulosum]
MLVDAKPRAPSRQCGRAPPRWLALGRPVSGRARLALGAASFLLTLAAYASLAGRDGVNSVVVPTLGSVARAAADALVAEEFWIDVEHSFLRVTAGFVAAAVLAVPLGVLAGAFRSVAALLEPPTEFLRYVPVPALIPLVMIVAGIGEGAKVLLVFLGTFFQLLLMTADEVRRVPAPLVQISQSLGATRREIVWRVMAPAALPGIWSALRMCNGWAWSYVVVAELVAATEGLGFRILRFYRFIQTPSIYAYLVVLGLLGLGLDWVFRVAHRRLFRWAPGGGP